MALYGLLAHRELILCVNTYTPLLLFHFQVIWKSLFGRTSQEHGTLGYFKSVLNRTPVKKDPKKNVDACLDLLLSVVKGHFLASACTYLGIKKLNSPLQLPLGVRRGSSDQQYTFVKSIANHVVNTCTLFDGALTGEEVADIDDSVYNYARTLCHYRSLVKEFIDEWHEGDGGHVTRCWRLLLPHFLVANNRKYALESLHLQMQIKAILSPHLAQHIIWDRFINTRGGIGKNVPCDLHNEHIKRLVKHIISCMRENMTEEALKRAARSVSTLETLCCQFDKCSGVPSRTHSDLTLNDTQDVDKVMTTVMNRQLLSYVPGRKHPSYSRLSSNHLQFWDMRRAQENGLKRKKLTS